MVILKQASVYLVAGSEQFLKEENINRIKSAYLDERSADFNLNIFYAGSSSAQNILECARTAPLAGGKRVILVRQIDDLACGEQEFILSYCKNPHKQTILILETSEDRLNQGFLAQLCPYAQVILCLPPKREQLFSWIKDKVSSADKEIEEEALKLLIANLDNNLQLLNSALDNIILYVGERKAIGVSDVASLVGPDIETSAFLLFDAILARQKEKALQILDSLLKEGINSSQIVGALGYKFITQRPRPDRADLFKLALGELQEADADIKKGRKGQRLALELLLARLLNL